MHAFQRRAAGGGRVAIRVLLRGDGPGADAARVVARPGVLFWRTLSLFVRR